MSEMAVEMNDGLQAGQQQLVFKNESLSDRTIAF